MFYVLAPTLKLIVAGHFWELSCLSSCKLVYNINKVHPPPFYKESTNLLLGNYIFFQQCTMNIFQERTISIRIKVTIAKFSAKFFYNIPNVKFMKYVLLSGIILNNNQITLTAWA